MCVSWFLLCYKTVAQKSHQTQCQRCLNCKMLLVVFFRAAVTRMARRNRRQQLQRRRRGTSLMPATVSNILLQCVSRMPARKASAFLFFERQQHPVCNAWCDLTELMWNSRLAAYKWELLDVWMLFSPFSLIILEMLLRLCSETFLLPVALCANARLRSTGLLLVRHLKY